MPNMTIHQSNLARALITAIAAQAKQEKEAGYTMRSAYLAGLLDTLAHIQANGQLTILPS